MIPASAAAWARSPSCIDTQCCSSLSLTQCGAGCLQRQIERIIDSGIKFSDIFDLKTPNKTAPFCPAGYTSVNAGQADAKHECLKLKVIIRHR